MNSHAASSSPSTLAIPFALAAALASTAAAPAQFALAFPAMWVGDKLGYALFQRHGTAMYRRVALGVLLAVGVVVTAQALL